MYRIKKYVYISVIYTVIAILYMIVSGNTFYKAFPDIVISTLNIVLFTPISMGIHYKLHKNTSEFLHDNHFILYNQILNTPIKQPTKGFLDQIDLFFLSFNKSTNIKQISILKICYNIVYALIHIVLVLALFSGRIFNI